MSKSLLLLGIPLSQTIPPLVVTEFTQSLGSNCLNNGNMETGNPPTGWVPTNCTPAVGEERTGGSGTQGLQMTVIADGAANAVYTLDTQLALRQWAEVSSWLKNVSFASNNLVFSFSAGGVNVLQVPNWGVVTTNWKEYGGMCQIPNSDTQKFKVYGNSPLANQIALADDVSIKRILLNTQHTMPSADAVCDFFYTLPASPIIYTVIMLFSRISEDTLESTYSSWRVLLQNNNVGTNWNFHLSSVAAGVLTHRITVTNIGDTVGFRHQANGSLHDCWTTADGENWTKRGEQVNLSHNDAATGVNTVYSSQVTPIKLTVTPL